MDIQAATLPLFKSKRPRFVRMMIPETNGAKLTKPATISQIAMVLTFEGGTIRAALFRSAYNLNSKISRTTRGAVKMIPKHVENQKRAITQFQMAEMSNGIVMIPGAFDDSMNRGGDHSACHANHRQRDYGSLPTLWTCLVLPGK